MGNIFKIFSYTRVLWKWYAFMAFFIIAISGLSLGVPILMKQIVDIIVDRVAGKDVEIDQIFLFLGLIAGTEILSSFLITYGQWIGDILSVRLHTLLSRNFYQHILSLDTKFYDNEITGRIVNKMYRGIASITDFVSNALNNFLPFFLTAVVTIVLLSQYSIVIAMLLTILFPAYILISHKSTQAWNVFETEKNKINDASQGRVFESISGIRVVKAFTAELIELTSYVLSRGKIEKLTISQTKQWHFYDFLRRLMLNVILFSILAFIINDTFHGVYTIGEMTLLLQLVQQARFPLFAMSFILGQIQMANAGSRDFFELLEKPIAIKDSPQAKTLTASQTAVKSFITFSNVHFAYDESKKVLSDISFSINQGEKIALVGESGQGKSTLINLLLRFYEPQKGNITIAGQNIEDVTLDSLHKNIAVVFQESLLFSGTILENIKYGRPDASMEDVISASKAANAHEFIDILPDGYESVIGEHGVKLSGGQKQRISIARAILKNAPIIVMDEATSSLDSRSEVQVQIGLDRLMKKRTSIIIAHRLSTIADADHVLVISKGTVLQYGTPKELIKQEDGMYAQMIKLQNKLITASREERAEALKKYDLVM